MHTKELEFRRQLMLDMRGTWAATVIEKNPTGPGIPDVVYSMSGDARHGYESGWLELKATDTVYPKVRVHVEPSQHRWITQWGNKVPCHFLVNVVDRVFLLNAHQHHLFLDEPMVLADLEKIALDHFHIGGIRARLPGVLRILTQRHGKT